LHEEKLSKKAALGVLSSDCISSSAYGTEEMLIFLLPAFGLAGFSILLPLTGVVLIVLVIMTLLYRQVVTIYTQAGGSYVVARDNFGPRVAQIASVALLIDYIVTVAVQAAAGTAAITSLDPALRGAWTSYVMTVVVILILAYGNLRGIREAGRAFAMPTYFFVTMAGVVLIVGIFRQAVGDLPRVARESGMIAVTDHHQALLAGASIYVLLKAFANGGASLTGLEAISNGVSAFKPPAGQNARRTLTIMSAMLGSLVLGISYLAFATHATPYSSGSPTVISQVAQAAFGSAWYGHTGFVLVQLSTALILYTGANTPFTGFPFLASFIADDSFLPRQMTRRGHRLAFSNGIIVLTVMALALVTAVGTNVDRLIPFYAIGVFTGFAMAGYGMARHYLRSNAPDRRWRAAISLVGAVVSTLVVLIFAVVKFTQGAWLVVVLFPVLWLILIRLNSRYRAEAHALDLITSIAGNKSPFSHYAWHTVLVFVDRLDLAVVRALRYAGSLRPTDLRAVHIAVDMQLADQLQREWVARGIADRTPLAVVECPDRRLVHTAAQVAYTVATEETAEVTVLLPRRTFGGLSQRLLHDRTADRIAAAVSRLPHLNATIVPFDTTLPADVERQIVGSAEKKPSGNGVAPAHARTPTRQPETIGGTPPWPAATDAEHAVAIGSVRWKQKAVVEGRVRQVQVGCTAGQSLEVDLFDETGGIRLLFFGRTRVPGLVPGARIRACGRVGEYRGRLAIANPIYELLPPPGGHPGSSLALDSSRETGRRPDVALP
jgi:amino acid transporter